MSHNVLQKSFPGNKKCQNFSISSSVENLNYNQSRKSHCNSCSSDLETMLLAMSADQLGIHWKLANNERKMSLNDYDIRQKECIHIGSDFMIDLCTQFSFMQIH